MTTTVTVTVNAVDAPEGTEPIASYTLDTGNDASKAFESQDWGALFRLQPAGKRSKDPSKVKAAATKRAAATTSTATPRNTPAPPPDPES